MTVTYIYHSCFLIEFEGFSLLFDYYKDAPREDGSEWIKDWLLNKEEELYVLCSHSHYDHFNPDILSWKERKKNIRYIFSSELRESGVTMANDAIYLEKEEIYRDQRLMIKAFGSTDVGGSFLIEYNNRQFFHAGDLNNWHWIEEVSTEEALSYENNFLCELELLAEDTNRLYLAMFPVDPRLGDFFTRGAEQFVARIKTDLFLPMHFGDNYDKANRFEEVAARYDCQFLPLSHPGQSFRFE
ncbi:MBL fold metallo-hydrolase [Proteiniphilum sp.]|uniref:MBL fold metallo-hydrolase n=1 Tax=Proteiniphilum sp. TaxID=1926877 RepID=UPI002B210DA3|nr:MBL fold metallo-hydrolase [Proteiniphilum sp.]MEA4916841.1 MBL fold metallo-hydrolase [Proteiniphilum sp.]